MFHIFYAFIWLITWLPLRVLYVLSDFFYLIVYYVVGYRKKVVRRNLTHSFPHKSTKELRKIERRFFRYFCDVFIETLYEMHMSKTEILRRFQFINPELITAQYAKGKSVLIMTAHYGNWEWASAFSLVLPKKNILYGIYKKLSNKHFDKLMYDLRLKFTGKNIETQDLLRTMVRLKNSDELSSFGMISDQTPTARTAHHWMMFLNQDTPVLLGTEQLAKKFDYPVFYCQINRVKRGYYTCEFLPIAMEPKLTAEFEITEKYMRLLEQKIEAEPEYWLWTHKRWKHKRTPSNVQKEE
jgi:KDO2-lipid IV(A) lauroyltransferase